MHACCEYCCVIHDSSRRIRPLDTALPLRGSHRRGPFLQDMVDDALPDCAFRREVVVAVEHLCCTGVKNRQLTHERKKAAGRTEAFPCGFAVLVAELAMVGVQVEHLLSNAENFVRLQGRNRVSE